jgi:HSF-type DNA-binding
MSDLESSSQVREVRRPFPVKVHEMLEDADEKFFSHIVSWNALGTGFMVHNKELFTKQIVPHYFSQTKYKSFQRQLSLYGFQRVTVGQNKGLRYHENLRRGERDLVRQMKPVGYKPRGTCLILEHNGASESATTPPLEAVPMVTTSTAVIKPTAAPSIPVVTPTATEEPPHDLLSRTSAQNDASDVTTNPLLGFPTVVSSNSLDRHGQDPTVEDQQGQHQDQPTDVHLISPGLSPIHQLSGGSSQTESCSRKDDEKEQQLQLGLFEGLSFYLMPPTQEFEDEMIPSPCVVNLPASLLFAVAAGCPPTPLDGVVQMAKAENAFDLTSTMKTPMGLPPALASLATIIHAPPTRSPAPVQATPTYLLDSCVDALDFHAVDVTARIT